MSAAFFRLRTVLLLVVASTLTACGHDSAVLQPEETLSLTAATTAAVAFDCSPVSEISQSECEALVAFFNSTDGPNWANNAGWLETTTPCSWFGVTCKSGSVDRLILEFNNLSGPIPTQIGDLSNLTHLSLFVNEVTGSIPSELGQLDKLTVIRFDGNQLSGPIPPELGTLSNLSWLLLSSNELTGSIPAELGNLSNLRVLRLARTQLDGPIPPELGNLSHLTDLDLQGNRLSGEIPPELGNLRNLLRLPLQNNQLSGEIPPELGNLTALGSIALSRNSLSGSIPPELGNLEQLQSLMLGHNQLSGLIPPELANLSSLQFLFWLDHNQLGGQVPIGVAQRGASVSNCLFAPNDDLFVPDLSDYRSLADENNEICGLPLLPVGPELLATQVEALMNVGILNDGQGRALLRKIERAEAQADAGRTESAIDLINAIIRQVEDFVADGVLTPAEGETLIGLAEAIRESIVSG